MTTPPDPAALTAEELFRNAIWEAWAVPLEASASERYWDDFTATRSGAELIALAARPVEARVEALLEAVRTMPGYTNGMTMHEDGSVSTGMERSDEPWMGDWLQRGPVLHAIEQALAAPDPATTPGERCAFEEGGLQCEWTREEHIGVWTAHCEHPYRLDCHPFAPTTPPAPVERAEVEG